MPHVWRKRFSHDPILEPLRGLVFLPTDGIVDGIFVGCAEGHFVPTNGEEGEAYVRDVRQIAKHRRATHERDLATQPKESSMVRELAAGGGVLMGQYLAEYCDHEVATALLEDPTSSEIPPLQRGLFHGLLRMRMLLIPKIYHPWWWHGAFARQLEVRLGRWAALAWVSGATLDPVTLNLIQYSIARAMFGEAAEIGMLGLDQAVQARLAERLDAMDSTHVLSAPEARAWARGERFEATERYAAPRMLMASHTDCKDFQWRSASYELYRLVLAGHFGAY